MEKTIFSYIWRYSRPQQLRVLVLTFLSFPLLYLSLEIPKLIINDALNANQQTTAIFGVEFAPVELLFTLCGLFLTLVIINGLLKMRINTMKGIIGERMVRRLRYQLLDRILRFPQSHFSKTSQGELVSTVSTETEPLAGFIGDSITLPVFEGGKMLTILIFMFVQDFWLGIASVALIPLQAYIIPKLQKQINALGMQRVLEVRKFSEKIGESVSGARDIRSHGTFNYVMAGFSKQLGTIFDIRFKIYQKKFFMKFINNFINQLTPFFFYAIGGLLVIAGDLSIGALVAAISAYKDLTSPWKELLSFYQRLQDATLKYLQIYEQFHPQGMMQWIPSTPTSPIDLKASYKVERLGISNDFGERILQNINFEVKAGRCIAIEVANPIQQSRLAMTLANILPASMGRIIIGDNDIKSLGSELLGKKLSFINPEPHIFAESILQNINYGLRYRVPEEDPEQLTQARKYDIKESIASGNSPDSVDDIWIDFSLVGVTGWEDYRLWWSQVAKAVGADTVLYQRGLDEVFSPLERPYLMQHLLPSRDRITQELAQQGLAVFVSRLDEDTYDLNACIMQNLFFGKLTDTSLNYWLVAQNIELQDRLRDSELWPRAMITGAKMAELVLAMIAQPEDDQTLIDDFINVSQASLDALRQLKDVDLTLTQELSHQQQGLLLSLFLGTIPTVHGENLITDDVQCAVLSLRRQFKLDMPVLMRDKIERFNPEKYHSRLSIWRNLLFGELSHNAAPDAKEQVLGVVTDVLEAMNIKEYVMVALGLSDTGIGGARLPPLAKHRIAYSRAIIKKPDIIIAQEPLPILDLDERLNILRRTRKLLPEASMILINSKVPDDPMFDQIYTIEDGSLKERGGLRTTTPVKTAVINDTLQPLALELNVLSNCPIFSDLSGQQIKNLAINGQFLDVPAEGYLYRRGAAVEGAYILVSGQALVLQHTANGDLPTVAITENELFGEVELIAETSRFHGVKAISHMKVFCLEGISFHLLLEANPELYTRIFKAISQRLNGNIYQAKADSDVDMA